MFLFVPFVNIVLQMIQQWLSIPSNDIVACFFEPSCEMESFIYYISVIRSISDLSSFLDTYDASTQHFGCFGFVKPAWVQSSL